MNVHRTKIVATLGPATSTNEIMMVSSRNWRTMSHCRAPTARRTPISRVRSSTEASMMFMMPMPPTSSEIDASATITISKTRCVRCCCARSSAGTTSEKSSAPRWLVFSNPRTRSAVARLSVAGESCR